MLQSIVRGLGDYVSEGGENVPKRQLMSSFIATLDGDPNPTNRDLEMFRGALQFPTSKGALEFVSSLVRHSEDEALTLNSGQFLI